MMEQKLRLLIKTAMVAKHKAKSIETEVRYQTFKNILENAQKVAKEKKCDVTDSMIIDAAKKEIKQLNDLKAFCDNDEKRKQEIKIGITTANELLPEMISEDQIKEFVVSYPGGLKSIGDAMKALREKYGDALDNKLASQVVRECLK